MARRKYKTLTPEVVAETALHHLIEKIPEMQANYSRAMSEFAISPEAQGRYRAGVSQWISIMRLPEIRAEISRAISRAKEELKRRIVVAPRVPVAVPAR